MDNIQRYRLRFVLVTISFFVISGGLSFGAWALLDSLSQIDMPTKWLLWGLSLIAITTINSLLLFKITSKPIRALADVISYAGHSRGNSPPSAKGGFVGDKLTEALAADVYDLRSNNDAAQINTTESAPVQESFQQKNEAGEIFDHSPLPLISLDGQHNITHINLAAIEYLSIAGDVITKPLVDIVRLQFAGEQTLDRWMTEVKQTSANASTAWHRVRQVGDKGESLRQFELLASFYAHTDEKQTQFIIGLNDKSTQYNTLDQEVSYLAMAVHELRTPLTVMKGYLEVLQDEVAPTLNQEMRDFITKTQANAQQLTAFVGNILNIARIDENALVLNLQKHDWKSVLTESAKDLQLRAGVHGKKIELRIQEGLPAVAIDRTSMNEVINNLVDNAIKYSGDSDRIILSSAVNADGMVETSVQDFGQGIAENVAGELFQKFYRSHKTKQGVSGTGIGLFLCKSLVNAHGGNIWVRSREGEGSVFSFTLQTYESANTNNEGQDGIERSAHGWIKNHSLNRQ